MEPLRHLGRLKAALPLIYAIIVVGAVIELTGMTSVLLNHWGDVLFLTRQQIELVAISGGLAVAAGVIIGIVLSRPRFRRVANRWIQLLNVGTSVPTLAVLALSMSFLGIGRLPAIVALWIATLLPIVRNTYVGLLEVPAPLLESATGMGMTPRDILLHVEIPNALWVIFAGIRTALTINVGTAPLAFLIGGGGLGQLIFTGISLDQPGLMLAGAIATAVMAVIIDFLIASVARIVVSQGVMPVT